MRSITFEEAINASKNEEIIFKRRENGFLLSDYQISILKLNGIDYLNYNNVKDLLFDIEKILDDNFDEELDLVGSQVAEYIYYSGRH